MSDKVRGVRLKWWGTFEGEDTNPTHLLVPVGMVDVSKTVSYTDGTQAAIINLDGVKECSLCHGNGWLDEGPDYYPEGDVKWDCSRCNGRGWVLEADDE